jgi:hypothetical protein
MPEPQPTQRNKRLNRRVAPKRATKAICYANALGLGANIADSVLDVSETGIRLKLKSGLKKGQEVQMTLETTGKRLTKIQAHCMWILPAGDGTFFAGFRFEKSIDWASFLALASN